MPRFGVAQMRSGSDIEENFRVAKGLVEQAAAAGCHFLAFPECFEWMSDGLEALSFAVGGDLVQRYCGLAATHRLWLSLGGFHELLPDSERIGNTHLLVDPSGKVVAQYSKTHLFDVTTSEDAYRESDRTAPGKELVAVKTANIGTVGLSVCYDLRFPELYAGLRASGCDLLLVPAAFMPSTGRAHWEVLLRARAIETQCWVIAAAQTGQHNEKRASYGHSLIIDPWGKVVAELEADEPGIAYADADPAETERIRKAMPVLAHRRTDLLGNPPAVTLIDTTT